MYLKSALLLVAICSSCDSKRWLKRIYPGRRTRRRQLQTWRSSNMSPLPVQLAIDLGRSPRSKASGCSTASSQYGSCWPWQLALSWAISFRTCSVRWIGGSWWVYLFQLVHGSLSSAAVMILTDSSYRPLGHDVSDSLQSPV